MSLLDEARKNSAVDALYQQIDAVTPITYQESSTEDCWSSVTKDRKTEIVGTPTKQPDAAMAHELLHAKLKIGGFRQYLTIASMDAKAQLANLIAGMLDNELQHHKIFSEFVAMGFRPEQFYHDNDIDSYRQLRKEMKTMKPTQLPDEFLRPFVTVIAPGGAGGEDNRAKLRGAIKTHCSDETWVILVNIEQMIADWKVQPSLDAKCVLTPVFQLLGGYDNTWLGFSTNFPGDGQFVGQPFTMEQLLAWHAENVG